MRFINYINESIEYSTIERDCKYYLDILRENLPKEKRLIRTESELGDPIIIKKTTRKDRKPRDTPLLIHNIVDDILSKKFGWKPRSEGVFCVISGESYHGWHHMLPVGKFSYVWSPKIEDLTKELACDISRRLLNLWKEWRYKGDESVWGKMPYGDGQAWDEPKPPIVELAFKYPCNEKSKKILKLVTTILRNKEKEHKVIMETIEETLKSYTNKDIKKYLNLERENEISINCNEYYMLSNDIAKDFFKKVLGARI
jgi:hypothetical protein